MIFTAALLAGSAITLSGCIQQAINAADNKPLNTYESKVAALRWPNLSPSARQGKWNSLEEDEQDAIKRHYHPTLILQTNSKKLVKEGGGGGGGGNGGHSGD